MSVGFVDIDLFIKGEFYSPSKTYYPRLLAPTWNGNSCYADVSFTSLIHVVHIGFVRGVARWAPIESTTSDKNCFRSLFCSLRNYFKKEIGRDYSTWHSVLQTKKTRLPILMDRPALNVASRNLARDKLRYLQRHLEEMRATNDIHLAPEWYDSHENLTVKSIFDIVETLNAPMKQFKANNFGNLQALKFVLSCFCLENELGI